MSLIKYNTRLYELSSKSKIISHNLKIKAIKNNFNGLDSDSLTMSNVNISLNTEELDELSTEEQDFIMAHELGHLECFLKNKNTFNKLKYMTYLFSDTPILDIKVNDKLISFNPSTVLSNMSLVSSYAGIFKLLKFNKFSIPLLIIPAIYSSQRLYFYHLRRKLEYDADKRAFNILGSRIGGIKYFSSLNHKWYDNFNPISTHPSNINRIKRLNKL